METAVCLKPVCYFCSREKLNWPDSPSAFLLGLGFRLVPKRTDGRFYLPPLNRLRTEAEWTKCGETTNPDGTTTPQFKLLGVDLGVAEFEDVAVLHELQRRTGTVKITRYAPRYSAAEIEAERRRLLGLPIKEWMNGRRPSEVTEKDVGDAEAAAHESRRVYIDNALASMRNAKKIVGEWSRCAVCNQVPDSCPADVLAEFAAKDAEHHAAKAAGR